MLTLITIADARVFLVMLETTEVICYTFFRRVAANPILQTKERSRLFAKLRGGTAVRQLGE